jgi:diguanylate cyclase (GGDEF)-like protein
LGGAVPAKSREFHELAGLFAQYGVEAFLESTNALVAILDKDGKLLSWNSAFEQLKQNLPAGNLVRDFLSSPSQVLFDEFLKNTLRERSRKQANLEFARGNHWGDFSSLFIPLPDERILLIAESVFATSHLETITAELETIKRSLANKETELQAVIAQADEVSHTDALTFLPNRKRIIADLQHETMFSDRYGTPLAISMLDIDHFKTINDTYGHMAGDDVLRKLAIELRDHMRHPDTIGRYGGEEFLIVLPHSTMKAAMEQAERLCRYVRSLVIELNGTKIPLTISIGIAQYKIHQEDWQEFLRRADSALYQAKNNGRDRWVVSEE